MKLSFQNLAFRDKGNCIEIILLKLFYFEIPRQDLQKMGDFKIEANSIEFRGRGKDNENKKEDTAGKFNFLLARYMSYPHLKCILNDNTATYINKNSGIPLMGNLSFGIVDRGSDIIEIKPATGCNMGCIFCSVDEGRSTGKVHEFVVEEEYIIEELKKIIEFKCKMQSGKMPDGFEIYINPHGEPLLYADIVQLVEDLHKIRQIKNIAIVTNGTLLNEKLADDLAQAGLGQLSISISASENDAAKQIMNAKSYDAEKLKRMIRYIQKKYKDKIKLILTPVWISGINDLQIEKLIEFAKELNCEIKIQNFLRHDRGRKPKGAKEILFDEFYAKLKELETRYEIRLSFENELAVGKTEELGMPFAKGDAVKAEIVCPGRYKSQCIGIAGEKAYSAGKKNLNNPDNSKRSILIQNCDFAGKKNKIVKVRILKAKNNLFVGEVI